ncbi:putative uncharacterized protein DDB_G0282133 [Oppia nitens]|uniref:putative uncharacterized protein DDB_G0282133 n=1 Tax=Oppia nitens TaxID=1686743 RepID=UPI0023D9FBBC|nr:putative uncharacterized protein DDB_G0282133 [Oppia nitens]
MATTTSSTAATIGSPVIIDRPVNGGHHQSALNGVYGGRTPVLSHLAATAATTAPVSSNTGPAPVQAYVLRLPDHQRELHRFIYELFDSDVHTDVTISLDDGQYIKAHKLVLSAFSSYFRDVLARIQNPSQYPVIVVKDMHYEDLRSLIEFIYRGCITVPNHRLPQVLKCAKELKIRGLYESNEENSDENHSKYSNSFATNCRNNVQQTVDNNNTTAVATTRHKLKHQIKDHHLVDDQKIGVNNNNININISNNNSNSNKSQQNDIIWLSDRNGSNETSPAVTNNHKPEFTNEWPKKSVWIPSPPKFSPPTPPALTSLQQRIALDLSKPFDLNLNNRAHHHNHQLSSDLLNHRNTLHMAGGGRYPLFPHIHHPSLFRSTSIDESQLNRNKLAMNGYNIADDFLVGDHLRKRAPSSLDGHLDDTNSNSNDLISDYRKEKKRSLNIYHAAKYRNRKKQQLETLFTEETELKNSNNLAKMQIDKLESTILSLIWQQTKKSVNDSQQTLFRCPVCGNVQTEVQKLRSHINMLHNDTEALMKFLMLQKSPSFTNSTPPSASASTTTTKHTVPTNTRMPTPIVTTTTHTITTTTNSNIITSSTASAIVANPSIISSHTNIVGPVIPMMPTGYPTNVIALPFNASYK